MLTVNLENKPTPWDMPSHGINVCECPVMTCLCSVCLHQKCSPGEGHHPLEEDELQKCQLCKQASKEVSWIPSPGICRRLSLLQVVPGSPTHPTTGSHSSPFSPLSCTLSVTYPSCQVCLPLCCLSLWSGSVPTHGARARWIGLPNAEVVSSSLKDALAESFLF